MFGGRQRSIFVGNNNNGKVYPYSPEQDFTFGNDEDSIQKNDSIVWGEVDDDSLTINVKASPKNYNNKKKQAIWSQNLQHYISRINMKR